VASVWRRIGPKFLHAGPGDGGSCFPKDIIALIKCGNDFDVPLRIAQAVSQVNEERKRAMECKVIKLRRHREEPDKDAGAKVRTTLRQWKTPERLLKALSTRRTLIVVSVALTPCF
jgi:hypothetical protein